MTFESGLFDIHSHILPKVDDGSASVDESRQLLDELDCQGVAVIAATPHFYADRDNPSSFFERRNLSFSQLQEQLNPGITILPGAEVYYYTGISRTEELQEFAIASTNLLLIEMPFVDWTENVIHEILTIQKYRKLQVVLAHIDRYPFFANRKYLMEMYRNGVLFQVNADAFLNRKSRGTVLRLLKKKMVHFVASDCHNMRSRMPRLEEAYAVIEKKLGASYIQWLRENSRSVLEGGVPD